MPSVTSNGDLLFAREGALVTLTLNRPKVRNAFSSAMRDELSDAIRRIESDGSVHAVLLCGAGGNFCSGGDVKAMAEGDAPTAEARLERMRSYHSLIIRLAQLDRPVVAAVDGAAFGAGFGLALLADIVVVSSRVRLCMAFHRVGLVPDFGASYSLPRVVGVQRAKEIFLSAREINAREAVDLGLALEAAEPEALLDRARSLAMALAHGSPVATGLTKRMLHAAPSAGLQQMLEMESTAQSIAATSRYAAQAFDAFAKKQPPKFQWPPDH